MKKRLILPIALIMVCALMGGCFNSGGQTPAETPAPGGIATPGPTASTNDTGANGMSPASTAAPDASPGMGAGNGANGGASGFDWAAQAAAVETRIVMFSEIQECRVVADQGTALVGVKFTGAYQGEMTQRIRDMIAGEVMAADNAIQVVAVTAEEQDVKEIFDLADQQRQGNPPSDLKQKIDQIARNTTTLR